MINQKYLKECLSYNPETGMFAWKERPDHHFKNDRAERAFNSRFPGSQISSKSHNGYLKTIISGNKYYLHRLAWLYIHGVWPDKIDHIDGNGENNALSNLRCVSHQENLKNCRISKNNKSGIHGVRFNQRHGKWVSRIFSDGMDIHLGINSDFFEACCLRKSAEIKYRFHENHGAR